MINLVKLIFVVFFIFNLVFPVSIYAQNTVVKSFGAAKSHLKEIYGNKNKTFYCNCKYQKKSIKKSCKLNIKKFKKRKKRLEWEHIVPAHAFGQSFESWRNSSKVCGYKVNRKGRKKKVSSRKCAKSKSKVFRFMEADLYNLVPAIGAVNALRSNFSMSDFPKKGKRKPLCSTGLNIYDRKIYPPQIVRGDIARIYLYMNSTYPGRGIISRKNKPLFEAWSKLDPIDLEECTIYKKKKKVQRNINPYLEDICRKKYAL